MREHSVPELPKWPFFFADAVFLGAAYFIYFQSKLPMDLWEILIAVGCLALGAWAGILPFILEYKSASRVAETGALTSVVTQVGNLEALGQRIGEATAQWQTVQEYAEKTSVAAKDIADRMSAELQEFTTFMQRANDSEIAALKLEVEKLRRAESEWLQVLVRVMDHVFALHQAAVHSNQPKVAEQVTRFQNACRDAARRIGLTPFVAAPNEPFDSQRHQTADGDSQSSSEGVIADTLATGYTFQGRLIRLALVRLRENNGEPVPLEAATDNEIVSEDAKEGELPLNSPDVP